MNKTIYIGTTLPEESHRAFKIKAAMEGKSVSALLKEMVLTVVATPRKPARRKEVAK